MTVVRACKAWSRRGLPALVLLAACSGRAPEPARPAPPSDARAAEGHAQAEPGHASSDDAGAACKEPLALSLTPHVSQAGIALSVLNRGPHEARIAASVALRDAQTGKLVNPAALHLARTCAPETCVSLSAGGELLSPVWFGLADAERCGELLRPEQKGSYLLEVRPCDCRDAQEVAVAWPVE